MPKWHLLDIYVEMPEIFGSKTGGNKVLKLKKSLYGLKQSPCTFYQHLSQGLKDRGWTVSENFPCRFMKSNMLCVIYVDDIFFAGPSQQDIEKEISLVGIKQPHEESNFEFCDEGEVFGMLMYLANNTRPDIAHAVHACARFTYNPKIPCYCSQANLEIFTRNEG